MSFNKLQRGAEHQFHQHQNQSRLSARVAPCSRSSNHDIHHDLAFQFANKRALMLEEYVASNVFCQQCKHKSLEVLGDCSPSLDIKCRKCNAMYEVKSKLSGGKNTPRELELHGGNYGCFRDNITQGLHLIVITYSFDFVTKEATVKDMLFASNALLSNRYSKVLPAVEVTPNPESSKSIIHIRDTTKLTRLPVFRRKVSMMDSYLALCLELGIADPAAVDGNL